MASGHNLGNELEALRRDFAQYRVEMALRLDRLERRLEDAEGTPARVEGRLNTPHGGASASKKLGSRENAQYLLFTIEKIALASQGKAKDDRRTCVCGRSTFDIKCFFGHHFDWCLYHQRPIAQGQRNCGGKGHPVCRPITWEKHDDWELVVRKSFDSGYLGTKKVEDLYQKLFPIEVYPEKYQDGWEKKLVYVTLLKRQAAAISPPSEVMSNTDNNIDDVRYQHHLEHRGRANQYIFWLSWSCIAVFVLARLARRIHLWWMGRVPRAHIFTPLSPIDSSISRRIWGFVRAIAVEPFPRIAGCSFRSLSSGSVIGLIVLAITGIALLLAVDAPTSTPHFIEDVAFRAAWVTITQIPLVFFLSTKRGLINVLAKVSYDRLTWLHKWVGRMIFVSATTHVVIMKSSISLADILLSRDNGATVVRFGVGSYFLLLWIAISSILPLRKWSYRAFYLNHYLSTLSFLMMIIQHVPKHATTPIFVAFGLVSLDKILVVASFLKVNISARPLKRPFARFRRAPGRATLMAGYPVDMLEPHNLSTSIDTEESVTTIRLCNIPMKWRPGQHIRMYLPALGALEMHPFTPANCSNIATPPPLPPRRSHDLERRGSAALASTPRQSNDILLMIRTHSGLTRRLKDFHLEWLKLPCPNSTLSASSTSLTAYVDGPYGSPPSWEDYENLVLVTTSTGVSFALSIMDYLEQLCASDISKMKTQTIRFIWITRHIEPQFETTVAERLRRCSTMLKDSGVRVETELYITCRHAGVDPSMTNIDQFAHLRPRLPRYGSGDRTLTIRNPDEIYDEWEEEERQWAEMEALEEMQMKEVDPFDDGNEVKSAYENNDVITAAYEGEGYASSETSTLLDGAVAEQSVRGSKTFSEVRLTMDDTAVLNQSRPLSSPVHSPLLPKKTEPKGNICQCALVQYQRQKLYNSGKSLFASTSYAARPDIKRIVTSAVNDNPHCTSMVAACANSMVSREVSQAVSDARFSFARGQRPTDVELFTEGFS
ncbi:hypothetical protein OPT61_g954 [Boeremia exigua]|uniref:Uncharacterized protein n=1 Tax=Boeremia exigua TaxID=749465 RepID=A0ACC2ISD1_9PLEO|nr:hypothetical protein OPT61_g954 [Boeremia exigua]